MNKNAAFFIAFAASLGITYLAFGGVPSIDKVISEEARKELNENAHIQSVCFRPREKGAMVEVCGTAAVKDGDFEFTHCYVRQVYGELEKYSSEMLPMSLEFWRKEAGL